jgi:hypothetical protein
MKFLSKEDVIAQNPSINSVWVVAYVWYENGHMEDMVLEGFLISSDKPEIPGAIKEGDIATNSEGVNHDDDDTEYGPARVGGYQCVRVFSSELF